MKRHPLLFLGALGIMAALAAVAAQQKNGLLILDWAAKAKSATPPVAILIELGLKDEKPTAWHNRAVVQGAKVVHREGYRFRDGDKLKEPDGWEATSHTIPARPGMNAAARAQSRIAPLGVVLQLADIQPNATITLDAKDKESAEEIIPLAALVSGQIKLLWNGAALVQRVSTATAAVANKSENDYPAAAYGPDGTLWLAYITYTLKDETRRQAAANLKAQPANFRDFYTPEFGDQLFVKCLRQGTWSEPVALTGATEDLVRCAVAVDGQGTAWVTYSANRQGNFDIYARPLHLADGAEATAQAGPEQRITTNSGPDLNPAMCTDQNGQVWLACQSGGPSPCPGVSLFTCKDGKWSPVARPAEPLTPDNSCWCPALAAGPDGQVALAYDVYHDGDYDVYVEIYEGGKGRRIPVATSGRFEARPAVAYDAKGRLWIAFEDGPENWGKDFGALEKNGSPLYNTRSVRVACLNDGKLTQPAAPFPPPPAQQRRRAGERQAVYAYPKIGIDGQGRVWLTARQKLAAPFGVQPGTSWHSVARRLDGDKWSEMIDLHHSDGMLDHRPVLLPHADGQLLVIHNTDRRFAAPGHLANEIYTSVIGLPGDAADPQLAACEAGTKDPKRGQEERAAVSRIREHVIENDGKKYRLLRGEFHRHTEISFDGGNDGSLEDLFRYARDCAALDWVGDGDHDNGNGREYTWWIIQKYTDAYLVANQFTPMFTYERSVAYPHGHRNCMFAKRGIRTLPRLAEPEMMKRVAGVHADDAKMLYRYLHEFDGICASHTSATSMGTDWRDNDPAVEPIVEIYQGDRNSYEYEDAPRSGHDPKGNKLPASIGGWQPAGFLVHAFKKGYKLGFQSSSDHISTHISFGVVLAEKHDREAILAAFKKRHCYGATDDIILDVRSGTHMMGDEFSTAEPPSLQIEVIGTKPVAEIVILKDSEPVETLKPGEQKFKTAWTDPKPTAGVHYYYVRVQQAGEQLAWSSPMWIEYAK